MSSLITEEMAREYARCSLYTEFIKQLQNSERNESDEFMQSLRCSTIYIPKPREVVEDFRQKATEEGLSQDWIDRFMPKVQETPQE